ncbi:MAG: M14 family metallopeptidase [Gammaproteobacteria bacterium]
MSALTVLTELPAGFLDCPAAELAGLLPGPTLFDLPGRSGQPLFVSVLLHGNEDTGLEAVKVVLRRHAVDGLPRPLLLFVGNLRAAAANVRTLPDQHDFNRVWPGTPLTDAPEAALMREVVDIARARQPFASIDIHNNTGLNPHYGCVNALDERFFHLARLFSRTVVYFTEPRGVQSNALAAICPAVTVECGKAGVAANTAHAVEFFEACLHLHEFPSDPVPEHDLELLRTGWIVRVDPQATLSFDGSRADFEFRADLDHLNFAELPAGTPFGRLGTGHAHRLEVLDGGGGDIDAVFDYGEGTITLAQSAMPSMLTLDQQAVKLDCLCYLMQRIDRRGRALA